MKRSVAIIDSQRGQRDENQDNYLLLTPDGQAVYLQNESEQKKTNIPWKEAMYRLAVTDGMGGHARGREISEALIQKLLTLAPQKSAIELRDKLCSIHKSLWNTFSQYTRKSSGTTLIMADIDEKGRAVIANIGDSRAFLWRKGQWKKISYDQNLQEYDWRDGEIEEEDYDSDSKKHSLAQAMGYGSFGLIKDEYDFKALQSNKQLRLDLAEDLPKDKQAHADIFTLTLQQGEALLLATDGLWSVGEGQQVLALPKPEVLADSVKLHQFFLNIIENGSCDNLTAVMLLWGGEKIKF